MPQLIVPLTIRLVFVQDAIHRPYGAVIFPFVNQDGEYLPRCLIGKCLSPVGTEGRPRNARQDRLRFSLSTLCRSEPLSGKDPPDIEVR